MVSSMFKIMICGISNEVPKIVKNKKMSKLAIYRKLKEEMFEDTEYRLSLWLPLTLQQKLDMVMHQKSEEEIEFMLFLIDQEFNLSSNLGNSDLTSTHLERSLDL